MRTFGPYPARILDWHDGDTCHLDIDVGFAHRVVGYNLDGSAGLSCRIYGINAPELGTDAGNAALAHAKLIAPAGSMVQVTSHSWDKYGGRFDGSITLPDGSDFAAHMLADGFAVVMGG